MPTKSVQGISNKLKAEAKCLGFSACGVARAEIVGAGHVEAFRSWIDEEMNAGMKYMQNYEEIRLNPSKLLPKARSVISVALSYFPGQVQDSSQPQFAFYAYGKDYHDVMREKLRLLSEWLYGEISNGNDNCSPSEETVPAFRICVDTAPMLERYWAQQAGIGWIGRNHSLIIPNAGSFFFLGEIVTTIDFDSYDSPIPSHCGNCRKCLDACPTKALADNLDARRCLSYLTIEHRGDFSEEMKQIISSSNSSLAQPCYIYGCDRCQLACPYNRYAVPTEVKEFQPSDRFLSMQSVDWKSLTRNQFLELFRDSAVKRVKYEGLLRNIKTVFPDSFPSINVQ